MASRALKKRQASMVRTSAVPVAAAPPAPPRPLLLDLGCGQNKKKDDGREWTGVDVRPFPGVDRIIDLVKPWPWADGSVDEIHTSHFVEHLDAVERVHFANEAYRVLKPGGKVTLIVPHWSSCRAYGDLTHKWPPVSEFWFYYLKAEWRKNNAPHNDGYACDFDAQWGFGLTPEWMAKSQETQVFAMNHYKDVCQDVVATLTKPAPVAAAA